MRQTPVYLDNHATTRVDPKVVARMLPFFTEQYGNAASTNHVFGTEAADAAETARQQLAQLLNVKSSNLIFTSGATESNNIAIKGVMQAAATGSHFITAAAEHRSVLDPATALKRSGYEVTVLPVEVNGSVELSQIADALQPNTVLVSNMAANNEVGTINAIDEIGQLCRKRGVLFHTDAVQAIGRIPLDLSETPVDLLSLTAHKLYGPKGVGALYVRRGEPRIPIRALFDGGGHERRIRSGTLPVPLVVGFGEACRLSGELLSEEAEQIASLRDRLWNGLSERLGGLFLNGHPQRRLPGNLNVSFENVDGDALIAGLRDIAVSSGSACTSADPSPSHVLKAMGRNDALTRASLRFGIGRFNTSDDIDLAISTVTAAVQRLRELATHRPGGHQSAGGDN